MGTLFKRPQGPEAPKGIDAADTENRRLGQRLRLLGQGGSGSTLLSGAMAPPTGAPRASLTGMG